MRSSAAGLSSGIEGADQPGVYFGPAQQHASGGGGARSWRCRRCRRPVHDHYLSGNGCVPREQLLELVHELQGHDLQDAARQDDQHEQALPEAVRTALAVLKDHGWQVQQERRHPDLDRPHRQTRLVAGQPWQDQPGR